MKVGDFRDQTEKPTAQQLADLCEFEQGFRRQNNEVANILEQLSLLEHTFDTLQCCLQRQITRFWYRAKETKAKINKN